MSINKFYKCISFILICTSTSLAAVCQTGNVKVDYKKIMLKNFRNKIMIDWSVETSNNVNYFEVQKSNDGKNFKTVMLVLGPDPKDESGCNYECFDKQEAGIKKYYYRLKHVDVNGNENISDIKMLAIN